MNASFCFSICSIFFIGLVLVFYFSKERLKNTDNKIYSVLMIVTFVGLAVEITSTLLETTSLMGTMIDNIILKLIVVYYFTWIYIFYIYTYSISNPSKPINIKYFILLYALLALISFSLPLNAKIIDNQVSYTYGPSVTFVYALSGIFILLSIFTMLKNIRHINTKKCVPLIAFILVGLLVALIQIIYPDILLMSSLEAFITMLMYFTIENPDVQMIKELYKNRKIIEKTNEDNSRFMFRITGDIKKPVKDIIDTTNQISTQKDLEEIKKEVKYINNNANQLDFLINKALNINSMNTSKIKIYETKYNVRNTFKEISSRISEEKTNLSFQYTISNIIPKYLYGDAIQIKEAITILLDNALKHTHKGFISLDVSAIIRYNICRLIITVEDSGEGMEIEKVNSLLNPEDEYQNENMQNNINTVKTILHSLGGSLMIKSELNKGTTITVTLDQKVVETEESEILNKIDKYEQTLYSKKKILLIDDDDDEIKHITEKLEKHDATVNSSLYERECIEKIKAKLKYDLIILDDTLGESSALSVLNELKQIKNFKIPVVVMLDESKAKIRLHYLQDGFYDCIMKSKLDSELERIIKRI